METISAEPEGVVTGFSRGASVAGTDPCPSCGNLESYEDLATTERICSQCGLVLDTVRAVVQEGFGREGDRGWQGFSSHGPVHASSRLPGALRTQISSLRGSGNAWKGSGQPSLRIHRLRQTDHRKGSDLPRGRDLKDASQQLHQLVAALGLPSHALESARNHLVSAARRRDLRGIRTPLLVAASVAVSSRENHVPRTLREVAHAAGVSPNALASSVPRLARLLGSHLPLVTPADLLPRISHSLKLSPEGRQRTVDLLSQLQSLGYPTSGIMPATLAGAAVLVATRKDPTRPSQASVSRACGVTTVALRHQVHAMEGTLAQLIIDDSRSLQGVPKPLAHAVAKGVRGVCPLGSPPENRPEGFPVAPVLCAPGPGA